MNTIDIKMIENPTRVDQHAIITKRARALNRLLEVYGMDGLNKHQDGSVTYDRNYFKHVRHGDGHLHIFNRSDHEYHNEYLLLLNIDLNKISYWSRAPLSTIITEKAHKLSKLLNSAGNISTGLDTDDKTIPYNNTYFDLVDGYLVVRDEFERYILDYSQKI